MPPVPLLEWDERLFNAAIYHARDMYHHRYFSHEDQRGQGVENRVEGAGYNWRYVGENIAQGQASAQEVFEGWVNSPSHCVNMMDANYKGTGAARAGRIWVQVFACSAE